MGMNRKDRLRHRQKALAEREGGTKPPKKKPLVEKPQAEKVATPQEDAKKADQELQEDASEEDELLDIKMDARKVVIPDTIQRIFFQQLVGPGLSECGEEGYVLGWGKRPKGARGHLKSVDKSPTQPTDKVYKQVEQAHGKMMKYGLDLEEGPYADKDGEVERLAQDICGDLTDPFQIIDRLVDILRPFVTVEFERKLPRASMSEEFQFTFNRDFGDVPDVLPTAGEILSQKSRIKKSKITGANSMILSHSFENMLLAVSVLRRRGINAYPCLGVIPDEERDEIYANMVSLVDLNDQVPLKTFALLRIHPDQVGSVDLLSDTAIRGVTHAMLAETRMKRLTMEMANRSKTGGMIPEEDVAIHLQGIAEQLFECQLGWSNCHYIMDALEYMAEDIYNTMMSCQKGNLSSIFEENPGLAANPEMIERTFHLNALSTAMRLKENARHYLEMMAVNAAIEED